MTSKSKMSDNTVSWTDLSYSGGDSLATFYIFIGVSSLLVGFIVFGALFYSLFSFPLETTMNYFWGNILGVFAGIVFVCSGVIHLSMAHNFKSRVRVIENLGKDSFKLTFWRRGKNKNGLRFLRQEIDQVDRCPDPENFRDFLLALPREPSRYRFRLSNGCAFHVAADEESVQKLLDILSIVKIEPVGD